MCGLQVLQEGLGPSVKKEVWWLVKPSAAMPVLVGLAAKGVAVRALIEKVVKGVGRPATLASQLVHEDVWSEATGVVEGEHMAHSKAEGSGGGVPGGRWAGTCLSLGPCKSAGLPSREGGYCC